MGEDSRKRIAYLGPPGTFTEEVSLRYDSQAELIPFPSIPAVGVAVRSGMADEGVVPIENSLEGSVPDTLDLLIHESKVLIRRELVLPIEHHFLVKPGTRANEVSVIYSHPQALAQCRRFVEKCFPKAQMVASLSTAAAVQDMMSASPATVAAIGTRRAASLYGAHILAQGIQDESSNLTRFVVLAQSDHPATGNDKTSLCFSFADDHPGLLHKVLQQFADRGINLAKIESRPTRQRLGRYIFLADIEGHRLDSILAGALDEVRPRVSLLKVFGSYPKYEPPSP